MINIFSKSRLYILFRKDYFYLSKTVAVINISLEFIIEFRKTK